MLSEKRIVSMTKMSIYNKGECKKDIEICQYYKYDYVSMNIIITLLWVGLIYVAFAGVVAIINIDNTLDILLEDELKRFLYNHMFGLMAVWGVLGALSFFAYKTRYENAQNNAQKYYKELYKVNKFYAKEEQ